MEITNTLHTASNAITPLSMDTILQELHIWRMAKKSMQERIPDVIWEHIFKLLGRQPSPSNYHALGISAAQIAKKIASMNIQNPNNDPTKKQSEKSKHIDFCEAGVPLTPPLYTPNKHIATNTLIVEFTRSDGILMKIHTTTDSFAELMQAFFKGF